MRSEEHVSALSWAREHAERLVWLTALDNYEPTRTSARGEIWRYHYHHEQGAETRYVLDLRPAGGAKLGDPTRALYLLDDGARVEACYVAGWREQEYVLLHPFPVELDARGARKYRRDDGRPVSFASWRLGPRRAYHLKLAEDARFSIPPAEEAQR